MTTRVVIVVVIALCLIIRARDTVKTLSPYASNTVVGFYSAYFHSWLLLCKFRGLQKKCPCYLLIKKNNSVETERICGSVLRTIE